MVNNIYKKRKVKLRLNFSNYSRWFNPLRRKMNRVLKVLKKQKTKLKRKPRARKAPKEERGARKEQESRGNGQDIDCYY